MFVRLSGIFMTHFVLISPGTDVTMNGALWLEDWVCQVSVSYAPMLSMYSPLLSPASDHASLTHFTLHFTWDQDRIRTQED